MTIGSSSGMIQSVFLPVLVTGFIFQYCILRYRKEWFHKYNYVLAIALDSGSAVGAFVLTLFMVIIPSIEQVQPISVLSPAGSPDYYCNSANYNDKNQ